MGSLSNEQFVADTLREFDLAPTLDVKDLSATITAAKLRVLQDTEAPTPSAVVSVGPLPRINVSGMTEEIPLDDPEGPSADLKIRRLLGEGGMARVYLAHQRSLNRIVAIKRPKFTSQGALAGACNEAVVTGFLEHPNIIPVHALGLDPKGQPLIIERSCTSISSRKT